MYDKNFDYYSRYGLDAFVREYGGDPKTCRVLLHAYEREGGSLDDIIDMVQNRELQSAHSLVEIEDPYDHESNLQDSFSSLRKQYGDYINMWLDAIRDRLKLGKSPADTDILHNVFLEETGLNNHGITSENLSELTTKNSENVYIAAPNSALAEYLAIEANQSEDVVIYRNGFLSAASHANDVTHNVVELAESVKPRHAVNAEILSVKSILKKAVEDTELTINQVAREAGTSQQQLSRYLSPTLPILPFSDKELLAIAGGSDIKKQQLDTLVELVIRPDGITSIGDLVRCVRDKTNAKMTGAKGIEKALGVPKLQHKLCGLAPIKTRDLVVIKSWLSEHSSDGQYNHIGVTRETLEQWQLEGVPIVSPERNEQDVAKACFDVTCGEKN